MVGWLYLTTNKRPESTSIIIRRKHIINKFPVSFLSELFNSVTNNLIQISHITVQFYGRGRLICASCCWGFFCKLQISSPLQPLLLLWAWGSELPVSPSGWQSNDSIELFTDATASIGFGGFFDGKWFQGHWAPDLVAQKPSIAFLEFYPLVVAVYC